MSKSLPQITVITVTYNLIKNGRKEFFKQCVESVHNQTYPNIEHLIIDGASTDGTVEMLQEYADKGWIKYISEPDSGIYDAMNKGVRLSHGEILYFLNTDDSLFNKDIISKVIQVFTTNKAQIVYGDIYFKSPQDGALCLEYTGDSIFSNARIKNANSILQYGICHQSVFYHRRVFEKVGVYHLAYPIFADYEFNIRAWHYAQQKAVYIPEVIANFELGGVSTNAQYENEQKAERQKIIQKYENIELIPKIRKIYILGILIWKVKIFNRSSKYYLFGFLPIFKIIG